MALYKCLVCDYIYDEAKGDPEHGYAPGTKFDDLPDNWVCPNCGVTKDFFKLYVGEVDGMYAKASEFAKRQLQ